MLTKVLALLNSKVALAVVGALVISGGGAAAVATAATGHVPILGTTVGQASSHTSTSTSAEVAAETHAHSQTFVGVLKSYDATAHTISVQPRQGNPVTITVDAQTKVNGVHATQLSDLTKDVGHNVEVEATKAANGTLTAWKVTVQGTPATAGADNSPDKGSQGSSDANQQSQDHSTGDNSQHSEQRNVSGKVTAVTGTSFTMQSDSGSVTVTVSAQTRFTGIVNTLTSIKVGMSVSVTGTSTSSSTIAATVVTVEPDH